MHRDFVLTFEELELTKISDIRVGLQTNNEYQHSWLISFKLDFYISDAIPKFMQLSVYRRQWPIEPPAC